MKTSVHCSSLRFLFLSGKVQLAVLIQKLIGCALGTTAISLLSFHVRNGEASQSAGLVFLG